MLSECFYISTNMKYVLVTRVAHTLRDISLLQNAKRLQPDGHGNISNTDFISQSVLTGSLKMDPNLTFIPFGDFTYIIMLLLLYKCDVNSSNKIQYK